MSVNSEKDSIWTLILEGSLNFWRQSHTNSVKYANMAFLKASTLKPTSVCFILQSSVEIQWEGLISFLSILKKFLIVETSEIKNVCLRHPSPRFTRSCEEMMSVSLLRPSEASMWVTAARVPAEGDWTEPQQMCGEIQTKVKATDYGKSRPGQVLEKSPELA